MRNLVLVLIVSVIWLNAKCRGQCNTGNCVIEEVTPNQWAAVYSPEVKDDTSKGLLFTLTMTDTIKGCPKITKGQYLELECEDNKLLISTNPDIVNYDQNEFENDQAQLQLQFTCQTGTCPLLITQKLYDVNTKVPEFEKSQYIFKLPMPWPQALPLTSMMNVMVEDIDFSNRQVEFSIADNDLVSISYDLSSTDNPKQHSAAITPKGPIDIDEDITLTITAIDTIDKYDNQHRTTSEIVIRRDREGSVGVIPKFSKIHYKGQYTETDQVEMEEIVIENSEEDVTPSLEGEYQSYFELKKNGKNNFSLKSKTGLSPEILENHKYVSFNLKAQNSKNPNPAVAVITVDLPEPVTTLCPTTVEPTTCPETTPCPEPPECEICPEPTLCTTETPVGQCQVKLQFLESDITLNSIDSTFTGRLLVVKATVFPVEQIIYTLQAGSLAEYLNIDEETAEISVVKANMIQGEYEILVDAVTMETNQKTSLKINLPVIYRPHWPHALIHKEIPENTEQKDFIKLDSEPREQGCKLEVTQNFPTDEDWFIVNEETQNIDSKKIPRDAVKDQKLHQVQIMVEIVCGKRSRRDSNLVLTADIPQNNGALFVNIDVLSTGNHPPVFVEESPYYIGYPNSELAGVIQPNYVFELKVSDEDEGVNGEINYSINNNDFLVNSKTGVIYPSKDASFTSGEIIITAVAIDGGGLSSEKFELKVLILSTDDVIILKLDGAMLEDVDKVMDSVSTATKWTIRNLGASVVPEVQPSSLMKFFYRVETVTQLTVYAYALDGSKVVKAEEFIKKVDDNKEEIQEGSAWVVQSVEPHSSDPQVIVKIEKANNTGLVIVVVILGLCLIGYIVASMLFYFKRNGGSDKQILLETATPPEKIEIETTPPENEFVRRSITLNDASEENNIDEGGDFLKVPGEVPQRKKSIVTFNEDVEEIQLRL